MKLSLFGLFFLLPFSLFGATELILSQSDSRLLLPKTAFPVVKTEVVKEEGKEFYLETRELKTSDGLIGFSCTKKHFAGEEVATQCTISADEAAKVQTGNSFEKGYFNLVRVKVAWSGDVSQLAQAFRDSGACQSSKNTQVFRTNETKELGITPGKTIFTPLLTVGCFGGPHKQVSQFVVMLVPR